MNHLVIREHKKNTDPAVKTNLPSCFRNRKQSDIAENGTVKGNSRCCNAQYGSLLPLGSSVRSCLADYPLGQDTSFDWPFSVDVIKIAARLTDEETQTKLRFHQIIVLRCCSKKKKKKSPWEHILVALKV